MIRLPVTDWKATVAKLWQSAATNMATTAVSRRWTTGMNDGESTGTGFLYRMSPSVASSPMPRNRTSSSQ